MDHKFSMGWFFIGMAEEVHAWIGAPPINEGVNIGVLDSPATASWKFPGNRVGSLEVVYSPEMVLIPSVTQQDDRIEITGIKGVIWITRSHGKMIDVPPVITFKNMQVTTYSDMEVGWESSFVNSTRHFIDAYFKGEPPLFTGEQGRDILRFTLTAQESERLGQSVKIIIIRLAFFLVSLYGRF